MIDLHEDVFDAILFFKKFNFLFNFLILIYYNKPYSFDKNLVNLIIGSFAEVYLFLLSISASLATSSVGISISIHSVNRTPEILRTRETCVVNLLKGAAFKPLIYTR